MRIDTYQLAYNNLIRSSLPTPLYPNLTPVQLSHNKKNATGIGTLILGRNENHLCIITAAHIFTHGINRTMYYRVLQPFSKNFLEINSAGRISNIKEDIALCKPGPKRIITGFSEYKSGLDISKKFTGRKIVGHRTCRHMVTGETIKIIGTIENPQQGRYFILDYENFSGQSGAGLLSGVPGELFVIRGNFKAPDNLKRAFGISNDILTVASLIKISLRYS